MHAIVVARTLVKVEMFRFGRTYQLLITKHQPSEVQEGRRPALLTEEIFRGSDGFLSLELYGKDKNQAGTIIPDFYARAGEKLLIPEQFHAAAQAITLVSSCIACVHSHYLGPFVPSPEP
ncbi:MAG TPA: hypothetical protein VMW38_06790 [Terriglobia bacterium]|nr:hypothetical protein [Terriglobia bacterium]